MQSFKVFAAALLLIFLFCLGTQSSQAQAVPTPPFNYCSGQQIGLDTSCRLLIWIDSNGSLRLLTDPNASPTYDGSDDTLIGVLNSSQNSIQSIPLKGPNGIFGFDGDGICSSSITPHPSGCPFAPNGTGYEGPGVTFSGISADFTSGVVNFSPALAPGQSTYFGLEMAIQTQCPAITPPSLLMKQDDPLWGTHTLGDPAKSTTTIAALGCFLTDVTMEINYYAQKQSASFRTDPLTLNDYLVKNNGFSGSDLWEPGLQVAAKYARANGVQMYFDQEVTNNSKDTTLGRNDLVVDQYLCSAYPPMLWVGTSSDSTVPSWKGDHWVIATGQDASLSSDTYDIIDPDHYMHTDLNNSDWANTYKGYVLFNESQTPPNSLYVVAHSPVELWLTASDGTSIGVDPRTTTSYNSIPASTYSYGGYVDDTSHSGSFQNDTKTIALRGPQSGTYTVQAIGTGSGSFTLDFVGLDINEAVTSTTVTGTASLNSLNQYTVAYSSTAGAHISVTSLPPILVALSASATSVPVGGTVQLTGTVSNDAMKAGVTWKLTGTGCSGSSCGSLSATSTASGAAIVYTAPPTLLPGTSATITATSVTDPTASSSTTITVTPGYTLGATLPTGVVSPGASLNVMITATAVPGATNAPLTLSCVTAPSSAPVQCSFSPATLTLTAGGSSTSILTLTDTKSALLHPEERGPYSRLPLSLASLPILFLFSMSRKRKIFCGHAYWLGVLLLLPLSSLVMGCASLQSAGQTVLVTVQGAPSNVGSAVSFNILLR